jgi:hypothetical protein
MPSSPDTPSIMTERTWAIDGPTSAMRLAGASASGEIPSAWHLTHSAPQRVLPAPRPPSTSQTRNSAISRPSRVGSWLSLAQVGQSPASSSKSSSAMILRKRRTALLLEHCDKLVRKLRASPSPIGLRASAIASPIPPHLVPGLDGRDVLDQFGQRREGAGIALRFAGRRRVRSGRAARLDLVDLALGNAPQPGQHLQGAALLGIASLSRRRGQPSFSALR